MVEASGLEARVLQHEIDHLDGVLMLDRAPREQRKGGAASAARGRDVQPRRRGRRRLTEPTPRRHDELRTVYLGTSEFAVAVLRASPARRTGPRSSSPRLTAPGRGRRLAPPPAADAARELGIELLQTDERQPPGGGRARSAPAEPEVGGRLRLRPADPRATARPSSRC